MRSAIGESSIHLELAMTALPYRPHSAFSATPYCIANRIPKRQRWNRGDRSTQTILQMIFGKHSASLHRVFGVIRSIPNAISNRPIIFAAMRLSV